MEQDQEKLSACWLGDESDGDWTVVIEPVCEDDRYWCPECGCERVGDEVTEDWLCSVCGAVLEYIDEEF